MEVVARFLAKVNKHGPLHPKLRTRCHIWTGFINPRGYGYFNLNRKAERAHRVAWFLKHGKWPTPAALHKCDNRACVRISHLKEGTQADNMRDMSRKGRMPRARCKVRLTEDDVREIKKAYEQEGATMQELALLKDISDRQVSRIVNGEHWRHVKAG